MKILITGATGFIGRSLGIELAKKGHQLVVLSRNREKARSECPFPCEVIEADLSKKPLSKRLKVDAVFNLQGEPIATGRWTKKKKDALVRSRVDATRNLLASLEPFQCFVSGSAIGFYGDRGDEMLVENSPAGTGFLADLCVAWETESEKAPAERIVQMRTGVVLGAHGGALAELLPLFRAGVAGRLHSGKQWMSWIHWRDMVRALVFALESPTLSGPVNAVAPKPVQNSEFTSALARQLRRPALFPVPGFALRLALGEKSAILLDSQRVKPTALERAGFSFQHERLETALAEEAVPGEEIFHVEQYLPKPPEEIFPFFAAAENLEKITPSILGFHVLKKSHAEIRKDSVIEYRLKIHGVPIRWVTKIDSWNPPSSFSDNQEKGPYALWHHTHTFTPLGGGTLMTDHVRYRLPFGYLGWLAGFPFVKRDVGSIFAYRKTVIGKYI